VDYSDSDTLQTIADIPEESAFYKFIKSKKYTFEINVGGKKKLGRLNLHPNKITVNKS
jgi:hypothetical protein